MSNNSQGWFSRIIDSSSSKWDRNLCVFDNQQLKLKRDLIASALALLVYEFLLTFDDEVELIWMWVSPSLVHFLRFRRIRLVAIQEAGQVCHQVVVSFDALLWVDITNVRFSILVYTLSGSMNIVLQRQPPLINAYRLHSSSYVALLQIMVYVAPCLCPDHACCRGDDVNLARSVAVTISMSICYADTHCLLEVYALYNRNRRIAIVLALLVCAELAVSGVNSYINIPKLQFNDVCLTQLAFLPVIQFGFVPEFIPKNQQFNLGH